MLNRNRIVMVGIGAVLFAAGYAAAQEPLANADLEAAATWGGAARAEAQVVFDSVDVNGRAIKPAAEVKAARIAARQKSLPAYSQAVASPEVAAHIAIDAVTHYYEHTRYAKAAVQVTQNSGEESLKLQSLQVVQNARIIELLQKIADRQKP